MLLTLSVPRVARRSSPLAIVVGTVLAALPAHAQAPHVESFDYPSMSLLDGLAGGTGWATPWTTLFGSFEADELLGLDGVYAQDDADLSAANRRLDTTALPLVADAMGLYGADGSSIEVRFGMQQTLFSDAEVVQFALFETNGTSGLAVFTLPGMNTVFVGGSSLQPVPIPGSSILHGGLYTLRIFFGPGPDTVQVFSSMTNPNTSPPDLEVTTSADLRFNEVGISVQAFDLANNAAFFRDIEVGPLDAPSLGSVGCDGQPNSVSVTGGTLNAVGSLSLADDDLTLRTGDIPDGFGIFFEGPTSVMPVMIGNGTVCIGQPHRRIGVVQAVNGEAALQVDLTGIVPGEARVFQFWHRDVPAGGSMFNFTQSRVVTFS